MRYNIRIATISVLLIGLFSMVSAQREHIVHDRGMLHESVFNNGIWSQPLKNNGIEWSAQPMMEWPGNSSTIVDGIEYDGQHNSLGGGIHIAVNQPGQLTYANKKIAYMGMVGSGGPETSVGVWTFPIKFFETENYPLLQDGSLNPDFDPNEAEQIVYAEWATSVGISVKRWTRSYSYPDHDDMVFHEYEYEFTGNTDADPTTIEMDTVDTLVDVLIYYCQSFAPSMYGYQRHYNQWKWKPGIFQGDNWASFDPDYWLAFNMDMESSGDDFLAGKPELSSSLFLEFASTGKNGGGFGSPQAVGYSMLYYDKNHLTVFDGLDPDSNAISIDSEVEPGWEELDENNQIRQPYNMFLTHAWFASSVVDAGGRPHLKTDQRTDGSWDEEELVENNVGPEWLGRAQFNPGKSDYPGRSFTFGPYTLNKGDKLEFSFVQVAGYGADTHKQYWGGHQKKVLWADVPSMNRAVVIDGDTLTKAYIDDFGYPDYINSDVITINDVARKAWEAYTGRTIAHDSTWADGDLVCWPEDNNKDGNYSVPIPHPGPVLVIEGKDDASVQIRWARNVEEFEHGAGTLTKFNIYRSFHPIGPWTLLDSVALGDVNAAIDQYEYNDSDVTFKVGDLAFYAVTSVNDLGMESGKSTNRTSFKKNIGAVAEMGKVYAVPNPFKVESGFDGVGRENQIGFYGLPEECTIRVYSFAGQLIDTIEHSEPSYSHEFFQVSRNNQILASGVYFYIVTTPTGDQTGGKFVIIK